MKKLITLFCLVLVLNTSGQIQLNHAAISQITHLYNPAEAVDSIALLHANGRLQWAGISQQLPYTGSIYFRSRINGGRLGFAASLNQYTHGVFSQYALMFDGAYALQTRLGSLQIGLRLGIEMWSNRLGDVSVVDSGDPYFQNNISSQFTPNQGMGMKYTNNKWIVGACVPRLMQHQITLSNQQLESSSTYSIKQAGVLVYSGYSFNTGNIELKPMLGLIKSDFEPINYWIDFNAVYMKQVFVGMQMRPTTSYSLYLGYAYNNMLQLSCAFEVPLNASIAGYTGEIGLKWFMQSRIKTKNITNE